MLTGLLIGTGVGVVVGLFAPLLVRKVRAILEKKLDVE